MARARRKPPKHPSHVEARYLRYLRRRVTALSKLVRSEVLPSLDPSGPTRITPDVPTVRTDAIDWRTVLAMLAAAFEKANPVPPGFLVGLVSQVDTAVSSPLAIAGVVPIPSPPVSAAWVKTNTDLIKSIDEKLLGDVAQLMVQAQAEGWSQRTAANALTQRTGVALSKAKLIARNEIGIINANITKQRQTALGVSDFIWRTSQDERVRDSHEALEGKRFSWSAPPAEGIPGEPINCRCTAEPVLDELAPVR